jgi:hypothetical protein
VNREAPLAGDASGKARLDEADLRDMIAFLSTLTDGYRP